MIEQIRPLLHIIQIRLSLHHRFRQYRICSNIFQRLSYAQLSLLFHVPLDLSHRNVFHGGILIALGLSALNVQHGVASAENVTLLDESQLLLPLRKPLPFFVVLSDKQNPAVGKSMFPLSRPQLPPPLFGEGSIKFQENIPLSTLQFYTCMAKLLRIHWQWLRNWVPISVRLVLVPTFPLSFSL